jgi:hypothetical protein
MTGSLFRNFVLTALKHWAVVCEYLDEEGVVEMTNLYEADEDDKGMLVASHRGFPKSHSKKWMAEPGAKRHDLGETKLNQLFAISFCKVVTERKDRYKKC